MPRIDNGGPAFPRTGFHPDTTSATGDFYRELQSTVTEPATGMTLRDWFAGQALCGHLAAHARANTPFPPCDEFARGAFLFADAMIAERQRKAGDS